MCIFRMCIFSYIYSYKYIGSNSPSSMRHKSALVIAYPGPRERTLSDVNSLAFQVYCFYINMYIYVYEYIYVFIYDAHIHVLNHFLLSKVNSLAFQVCYVHKNILYM
jgi:hypothetical protein